jgi:hypothetical protein
MWTEVVVACLKALLHHSPGGIEGNLEKSVKMAGVPAEI